MCVMLKAIPNYNSHTNKMIERREDHVNHDESTEHDVNMEDMDDTEIVFQIILYAGNARSSAMEAIELAKAGKFREAKEELASAKKNWCPPTRFKPESSVRKQRVKKQRCLS